MFGGWAIASFEMLRPGNLQSCEQIIIIIVLLVPAKSIFAVKLIIIVFVFEDIR